MNISSISVISLHVIKTECFGQTNINSNPRKFHSLSYRIKGENTICVKGREIQSNARSLTLVPAGTAYEHRIQSDSSQIVAHFTTIGNIADEAVNITLPESYGAEQMFQELYETWERCPIKNNVESMAVFYKILVALNEYLGEAGYNKNQQLLKDSVEYMNMHYRENDFNISSLYGLAHISPAYYRRVFRDEYGCSPMEYMLKLRTEHAKRLLSTGHYTVSEIAEQSGFSSQSHFSFEFKKRTGKAPSRFINE